MKLLAWLLLTPFLIAGAGIAWLVLNADWAGPNYVAVPASVSSVSVKNEMRYRRETIRLDLRYSYAWNGDVYKGWRFSCETFGGNEIMPRRRNRDALERELQAHVQEIQQARQVLTWVDSKRPGDSCLFKDGRFAWQ